MTLLTLRARYIFPVAGPPITNGAVSIDAGRIVSVGVCDAGASVFDLGNVAILPGLVNAHVHLDLSDFAAPLGQRGMPFVDWIRRVMQFRRQAQGLDRHPVALGLSESLRWGVTTLGDIAQPGWSADELSASPLGVTVFQELIAPTADRVADAVELARSHLNSGPLSLWERARVRAVPGQVGNLSYELRRNEQSPHPLPLSQRERGDDHFLPLSKRERGDKITLGLSPHAPYTVHPQLLAAAIELSTANQVPLAMHLAESREELELLRHGGGPLRTLLDELGAWDATAIARGTRPLDYLRRLASAHRTLVIHGNYLDDEEIALLATNRQRMAVAYCPRTHDWFAHDAYPLEKMLAAGAMVALGTDGRSSSPDLNLLAEMRFATRRHPAVGLDEILKMGTINGARALGQAAVIGSIEPGKQADLTIVPLPDRDAADPHELLFDSEQPATCYCSGARKCVAQPPSAV